MKKTVKIQAANPIEIYGAGNKILEEFCSYFPGLKVVARGDEIILDGKQEQIQEFESRFAELVELRHRKQSLTSYDVESIFCGSSDPGNYRLNGEEIIVYSTDGKPIRARNLKQQEMVKAYFDNDLVFALGPAGTGKTYVAIALAVRALKNREIKRIILTRPAVEAGERLGFLPGDLKDKLDPYLQPLYDALGDMIPAKKLQDFIADGIIQIAPLAYMRGRTLDNSFIILDEAQNTTSAQIKMFLTRMGMNTKIIVTGDMTQIDLPINVRSGLAEAIRILKGIPGIGFVELSKKDIVRHRLVTRIVEAYEKEKEKRKEASGQTDINK